MVNILRHAVEMVRGGEGIFVFNVEEKDHTLVLRVVHTRQCFQDAAVRLRATECIKFSEENENLSTAGGV